MNGRKRSFGILLGLLVLSAVGGCAGVRMVRETPDGGVVALPMNCNCWPMYYRDRAAQLMKEKCPAGYQIDNEEYVWNGREGPEGHRFYESYFGYTDPDDETAPYRREEYHISFHATPPPAPPPAAPASPPRGGDGDELPPPRRLQGVPK